MEYRAVSSSGGNRLQSGALVKPVTVKFGKTRDGRVRDVAVTGPGQIRYDGSVTPKTTLKY